MFLDDEDLNKLVDELSDLKKTRRKVQSVIDYLSDFKADWDIRLRDRGSFKAKGVEFLTLICFRVGGRGNVHSSAIIKVKGKQYVITQYVEYWWDEAELEIMEVK